MSMTWFKAHTEARVDPKLRCLTRDEHYVWFNLLCYAADQPERGTVESFNDQVLAYAVADGDVELLVSTIETLVRLRIVSCVSCDDESVSGVSSDDECVSSVSSSVSSRVITFVNFAKRQYRNTSKGEPRAGKTSTERVRKCRVNKKMRQPEVVTEEAPLDETPNETPRNAVKQERETTDTETDTETEAEKNTPQPPTGGNGGGGDGASLLDRPEDASMLRSQRKSKATPQQLQALIGWSKTVIGARGEIEDYFMKLPGWACSYPIGWIETAVLCAAAKSDIRPGGLAQYTNGCLARWLAKGGPSQDESKTASRQRSETRPPVQFTTAPSDYAAHIG